MRLFALIATFLWLSACQTLPNASTQIEGHTWLLNQIAGSEISHSGKANLSFQAQKINGNAGCNRFFASYQRQESQLRISQIGATKMYCTNMAEEQAFLTNLSKVHRFQVIDNKLQMYSEAGQILLIFSRKTP